MSAETCEPRYVDTTKGGTQKHCRQSDGRIVPMKARSSRKKGYNRQREVERESYLLRFLPCKAISAKET